MLGALYQSHHNLRSVDLNIDLPASAHAILILLIESTNLSEIHLGPLLNRAIDDWTIADVLEQTRLRILEIHSAITTESLAILRNNFGESFQLDNLERLTITINLDDENVTASLFVMTPNLKSLDVVLGHDSNYSPWVPDSAVFQTFRLLNYLHTLSIGMKTIASWDDNGELVRTAITGADSVALISLPLQSLSIKPCRRDSTSLELIQVSGAELSHALRSWEHIPFSSLGLRYYEVFCDQQQAEEIHDIVFRTPIHYFWYGKLIIVEHNVIDPFIWLGNNASFSPDPQHWESRHLHHSSSGHKVESANDECLLSPIEYSNYQS